MKHSPSPTPAGGAAPSASRRNFLRGIPVITAAAATGPTPAMAETSKHHWGMLVAVRKRIGC